MKVRICFALSFVVALAAGYGRASGVNLSARAPRVQGEQIVRCPIKILAGVLEVPKGWKQVPMTERFHLTFKEMDSGRLDGKTVVNCYYGGGAGEGTIISMELPPTFGCRPNGQPREMQCKSIIKIPGKGGSN